MGNKKRKWSIWLFVLAVLVGAFLMKDVLIKASVELAVRKLTGLSLKIDGLKLGLTTTLIDIKGMRLHNPAGFEEEVMVDIPVIYVDYDLPAILKGKVHLSDLRLYLKEITIVTNKDGRTNLEYLKTIQQQKQTKESKSRPTEAKKQEVKIDNLSLKVDRVVYRDHTKGEKPVVREFNIGLDQSYKDINDLNALVGIIIERSLARTTIANLTGLDLTGLTSDVSGTLKTATGTTKELIDGTTETIKQTTGAVTDVFKKTLGK
jgi:uncharacterized protein involved in outer membrane biogenesis